MRAALYARYSSDRQNPLSVADQLALLRRHAAARGWTVVATYSDEAISGFSAANRPGVQALQAAAEQGAFDLVLVEDPDRLARNDADGNGFYNLLTYLGITLATPASDRVTKVESSVRNLLAQLTLENISGKTSRGMRANAERGLATGSRLYGYRSQPGGEVAIVPEEAEVVRRIFGDFIMGFTPRQIAERLNRERVPGPRGGWWTTNTIQGSRSRANGILHTELYAGVKVWNRLEVRKDPRTGRRLSVVRPESEWQRTPVPHLAIVDPKDWQAVRARKDREARSQRWDLANRHRAGVFSGLLKCAACGSTYTAYSKTRLVCAGHREKGAAFCANARMVDRAPIEERILQVLKARLLTPEAVAHYVRTYHRLWAEKAGRQAADRAPLDRRIAELTRRIERTLDAVEEGHATPDLLARLKEREAEREQLRRQLASLEAAPGQPPVVTLHPAAAELYAGRIADLQGRLAAAHHPDAPAGDRRLRDLLRDMIERIEIAPGASKTEQARLTLTGDLARFLSPGDAAAMAPAVGGQVVAGGSYSLTPRLPFKVAC